MLAYSLVNHIHEREVGWHCGRIAVAFMPHVAPFFQGIHLTVTGYVRPSGTAATTGAATAVAPAAATLGAAVSSFYEGEKLVRVLPAGECPDVARHGTRKHGVTVGGFTYDAKTGRLAMVSVLDNLLKGAATQAVQNLNLALGLPEYAGIPLESA